MCRFLRRHSEASSGLNWQAISIFKSFLILESGGLDRFPSAAANGPLFAPETHCETFCMAAVAVDGPIPGDTYLKIKKLPALHGIFDGRSVFHTMDGIKRVY